MNFYGLFLTIMSFIDWLYAGFFLPNAKIKYNG